MPHIHMGLMVNDEPLDQSRVIDVNEEAVDGNGRFVHTIHRSANFPTTSDVMPMGTFWIVTTIGTQFISMGGGAWVQTYHRSRLVMEEDWATGTTAGLFGWTTSTSGGAASWAANLGADNLARGIVTLTANNGNNGTNNRAAIHLWDAVNPLTLQRGLGFDTVVRFEALSDATNPYRSLIGMWEGVLSTGIAEPNSGFWFEYNAGTSANWVLRSAASGARTNVTSTIPVVAGEWIRLVARLGLDGTTLYFYIDGVLAGSISATLPTGLANGFEPTIQITRRLVNGTLPRSMYVDSYSCNYRSMNG